VNGTKLLRWIDALNEHSGRIFAFTIIPLTIITATEVVSRYIFHRPTIWAWDVNIQLFGLMIMMGAGYNLLKGGHVRVDVIVGRLPERTQRIIDLIIAGLFFFSFGTFIWLAGDMAWSSVATCEEYTSLWQPPIYPFRVMIVIGAFLLFLQGAAKFIRDINYVIHAGRRGKL